MKELGNREIREAILKISGAQLNDPVYLVDCIVNSVDRNNLTCDCTPTGSDSETVLSGVLLMPENSDGLVVFPAVDSSVKVLYSSRTEPFIVQYSDIDEVEIFVDGTPNPTKINIKQGEITFNDGSYDGLVRVSQLATKLNNLENLVNNMLIALKATVIPLAPSGTYPFAPLYAAMSNLTPTIQSDIENDKIKHGI